MSVAERNRTVARFRYKRLSRECKKKLGLTSLILLSVLKGSRMRGVQLSPQCARHFS